MVRPLSNPLAAHLTPQDHALLAQAPDRYMRSQLVGFLGHLRKTGRPLLLADEGDLLAYRDALAASGVSRPKQAARDAARAWNAMIGIPGWPKTRLVPPRSGRVGLRYGDLPAEFRADCDRYFAERVEIDDENLFEAISLKPMARATIKDRRGKLCQLVGSYVEGGGKLTDLKSLHDLTTEAAVRKILSRLWAKTDRQPNAHGANLARFLRLIAHHHCHAPEGVVRLIRNAENRLKPAKAGMTARNRARLRTLLEDTALQRLLRLPMTAVERLDVDRPTLADAVRVQSALAIRILLQAPMRAKNLAALDLERHFDVVSPTQAHIVVEAEDVKNGKTLDFVIGGSALRLLELYVDVYRPLLLADRSSSALFVSRTGRVKTPAELGAQIQRFILEETGLRMHTHLFRHLCGFIYLRAFPGQYEPVRQLLGHKDIRTTVAFYLGLEEDAAFKRYGEVLDRLSGDEEDDDAV